MNPKKLQSTTCSDCGKEIQTTYDPNKRKILCEECYRKLVY